MAQRKLQGGGSEICVLEKKMGKGLQYNFHQSNIKLNRSI